MVWKFPDWYDIEYNLKSILFCYAFKDEMSKKSFKKNFTKCNLNSASLEFLKILLAIIRWDMRFVEKNIT